MEKNKICKKCNVAKPVARFYKRSDTGTYRTECIDCDLIYKKQWVKNNSSRRKQSTKLYRETHKNQIIAYNNRYSKTHKEERYVYNKKWQQEHPDKVLVRVMRYQKEHPEKVKESRHRYQQSERGKMLNRVRAHNQKIKRRSLAGHLSIVVVRQTYKENKEKYGKLTCELCFRPIKKGQDSIEHFIPVTRSGTHNCFNLGVAHSVKSKENCNTRKGNMTADEWFEIHPKYKKRIA